MMIEIQDALIETVKNARCYPALAILYINRSERFYGVAEENPAVRQMIKRLHKALPPRTPLIGALAGGVIGCIDNLQVEEVEQTESASLLLIPSSPSLEVHPFFIKLTDVRSAGLNAAEWEKLIGCPKSMTPKVALMHACCDTNEVHYAVTMISQLFGDDVPIAGGIAEYLVDNNKLKSKGIAGVLLGGNLTASLRVSVGPDMKDLCENLTQMKAEYCAIPNSLMLMYCCVARGQQLYEKPNAETNCVREIFGKIPVFGFFAFGEVGKAGDGQVEHGRRRSESSSSVHSFSTVSCYCVFG